jgi:hypothetical protein
MSVEQLYVNDDKTLYVLNLQVRDMPKEKVKTYVVEQKEKLEESLSQIMKKKNFAVHVNPIY